MNSTKHIEIVQIDAFTAEAYSGNPAAVVLLKKNGNEKWMRNVAREMNLSETAFLYPIKGGYHLRWLTPKSEVDLCGHATLATAHLLFEDGHELKSKPINFKTRVGWVSASLERNLITLNFPLNPPKKIKAPAALVKALGVKPKIVLTYPNAFLVELSKAEQVRKLNPSMTALEKLNRDKVCVTARSDTKKYDFISRLFAPKLGIPEDPVNGNSHTALTPYWGKILNKNSLRSFYASERGGEIFVSLNGDRVKIGGRAVTVMRAKLLY